MFQKLYFYSEDNKEVFSREGFEVVITRPLDEFKKKEGLCANGKNGHHLLKRNIGKKFNVSILDPYEIGECVYLGSGIAAVPDGEIKDELQDKLPPGFLVFKNEETLLCVYFLSCDVEPVV